MRGESGRAGSGLGLGLCESASLSIVGSRGILDGESTDVMVDLRLRIRACKDKALRADGEDGGEEWGNEGARGLSLGLSDWVLWRRWWWAVFWVEYVTRERWDVLVDAEFALLLDERDLRDCGVVLEGGVYTSSRMDPSSFRGIFLSVSRMLLCALSKWASRMDVGVWFWDFTLILGRSGDFEERIELGLGLLGDGDGERVDEGRVCGGAGERFDMSLYLIRHLFFFV
jgi:hypothetical protein